MKLNTASPEVPTLVTLAFVPAAPVVIVPIAIVADLPRLQAQSGRAAEHLRKPPGSS